MASLARYLETNSFQARPMPRQFLLQHMKMSTRTCQPLITTRQLCRRQAVALKQILLRPIGIQHQIIETMLLQQSCHLQSILRIMKEINRLVCHQHNHFNVYIALKAAPQSHCLSKYPVVSWNYETSIKQLDSRHIKSHTRPHTCAFPGCRVSKAEQRDLDRHQDTHGKIRLYFCPVARCSYDANGTERGFSRRLDNAKRHLKSHDNHQNMSVLKEDSQGRLSRV